MSSSIKNEPPVERVREDLKKPADVLGLRGNVWYLPGYLGEKNNDEKIQQRRCAADLPGHLQPLPSFVCFRGIL